MRIVLTALLGAALLASAPHASARALGPQGVSVAEVQQILRARGLSVQTAPQENGDPGLTSTNSAGINFDVWFFECERNRCASIQIWAGFDTENAVSLDTLNAWNRDWRFARAYRGEEDGIYLEMDLATRNSSTEQIRLYLDNFDDLAGRFAQAIGYEPPAAPREGGTN